MIESLVHKSAVSMVKRSAVSLELWKVEQMDWTKIAERVELMETSTVALTIALTVGVIGALNVDLRVA